MLELDKGANAPIPANVIRATLTWEGRAGVTDVDASAVLCGLSGLVSCDADFVFFNQVTHPSGAVLHLGKSAASDSVAVDLASLPITVDRVALAASCASGNFGQVPALALIVTDVATSQDLVRFSIDADAETALIAGEFYRRGGSWRFRAVGQGYNDGLSGLARDFGIHVDDPKPPTPLPPTSRPGLKPDHSLATPVDTHIDWMNPPVPAGYEM